MIYKIDETKPRICPYCKQEYQIKTGFHNWKNLFRKPTLDDWITLIILILILATSYAYRIDTKTCRETLKNLDNICLQYNYNGSSSINPIWIIPNLSLSNNLTNVS